MATVKALRLGCGRLAEKTHFRAARFICALPGAFALARVGGRRHATPRASEVDADMCSVPGGLAEWHPSVRPVHTAQIHGAVRAEFTCALAGTLPLALPPMRRMRTRAMHGRSGDTPAGHVRRQRQCNIPPPGLEPGSLG